MTNGQLPAIAERYLQDLEAALWPLGSDERETILLELRSHLADCGARGPERVANAIKGLGSPAECARAFVTEGAGEAYRRGGMPGRALVPIAPAPLGRTFASLGWRSVIAHVRGTYLASRHELWGIGALVLTVMTATNFLSYIAVLRPGSVDVWPLLLVRVVVLLSAVIASYRAMLNDEGNVWAVNLSSLRAAGGLVAILLGTLALLLAAKGLLAAMSASPVLRTGMLVGILIGASLGCLRLQPWIAALAADRSNITLRRVHRGMSGKMTALIKGWALLVLPLMLAHYASAWIIRISNAEAGGFHLLIAGVDGVITMGIVLAMTLLNATAFRWVAGEPIPAPRRFADDVPDDALIEEARLRLKRHIDSRASSGLVRHR
jgi:hypothetical protein